jgi:predicted phosphodiesterase
VARSDPQVWTPERKPEVEAALRGSRNRTEAAKRLKIGLGALDHACRTYGLEPHAELRGLAPLPPVSLPPEEPGFPAAPVRSANAVGIERRIVIGDVHFPAHSASALAAVYALIRALQPHRVIQIGDLVNSQAFTRHGSYSPQAERYDLSMMAARGFIRSVKRASPGSELIVIRGNHDDWASRYETENPGLEGSFDFETLLGVKALPDDDRDPPFPDVKVVRHAESNPLVLGPVAYMHGNGGGLHFAKRYAENNGPRTGVRVVRVGHHHTLQVFCHRNGIECWGVGWVGDERHPAFHYAPPPRGWWVGAIVEDIVGDRVTTTPVPIVNGTALYGGRIVEARAA